MRKLLVKLKESTLSVLPIIALLFAVFQAAKLKLNRRALLKILVGTLYTYAGLVLFLTTPTWALCQRDTS
ncbi:MAG: DUF1538 family protein [Clostridiales bacterium]|nr:DUF1538 family protein [Clostridiales bacterium]